MPDALKIGDTVWVRATVIALPDIGGPAQVTLRITLDDDGAAFLLSVPMGANVLGEASQGGETQNSTAGR